MMKKEYSKRKFTIAVILSAILLLLISATTVHADANPLAKMPRKDSTVITKEFGGLEQRLLHPIYLRI